MIEEEVNENWKLYGYLPDDVLECICPVCDHNEIFRYNNLKCLKCPNCQNVIKLGTCEKDGCNKICAVDRYCNEFRYCDKHIEEKHNAFRDWLDGTIMERSGDLEKWK